MGLLRGLAKGLHRASIARRLRAGILLNPPVGALLMSLSAVIVAINAMLLRRVQLV